MPLDLVRASVASKKRQEHRPKKETKTRSEIGKASLAKDQMNCLLTNRFRLALPKRQGQST